MYKIQILEKQKPTFYQKELSESLTPFIHSLPIDHEIHDKKKLGVILQHEATPGLGKKS